MRAAARFSIKTAGGQMITAYGEVLRWPYIIADPAAGAAFIIGCRAGAFHHIGAKGLVLFNPGVDIF